MITSWSVATGCASTWLGGRAKSTMKRKHNEERGTLIISPTKVQLFDLAIPFESYVRIISMCGIATEFFLTVIELTCEQPNSLSDLNQSH